MDEIDREIITILKKNSRISASAISKSVNLSVPAVLERMNKLDKQGYITQYTVKLDRKKTGCHLTAFICVVLEMSADIKSFRKAILNLPNVLECHHIAGKYDYILKISVKDTDALEDFLINSLKKIDGVASSNTLISLSVMKEEFNL